MVKCSPKKTRLSTPFVYRHEDTGPVYGRSCVRLGGSAYAVFSCPECTGAQGTEGADRAWRGCGWGLAVLRLRNGSFSSRKLERATYDSVAFRYIAANDHPDHDTIAAFRKRFLSELKPLFVQILLIAQRMNILKLGKVSLDGTKIKANASKHRALSWKHACKLEKQLKAEVEKLLRRAEEADKADQPDGLYIVGELSRRKERLTAIARAKAEIEERARERHAEEQADYEQKLAERKAKEQKTGKKARGRQPKPPEPGPRDKDQVNLTDRESRIMPISGGGFEQSYNAQAGVDVETMLVISRHLSQKPNDKLEIEPALEALSALPEELGAVDAVTEMKHRLKTRDGRALYAKRKSTVEPVFGIIKAVMGFRQFQLRGVESVRGEWDLVCMAWNLKRLHALMA